MLYNGIITKTDVDIMPKPILNEEREKIIKHKLNGEKEADIARWLFISKSAVSQIWGTYQRTKNCELRYGNCGRKSVITTEQEAKIIAKIKKTPDVTLLELIDKFALEITEGGLSKWLKKRGFSFKKRLLIQQSKSAPMSKRREKSSWKR
jgi:transposase